MSAMPECIKCGDYVYHGYCICYEHTKEIFQWASDVLERGITEPLRTQGAMYVRNYNRLLEDEAEEYKP